MKKLLNFIIFVYLCMPIRIVCYFVCAFLSWQGWNEPFWEKLIEWLKDEFEILLHPIKTYKSMK